MFACVFSRPGATGSCRARDALAHGNGLADPIVVFDLTPLDTDSRLRGFGRYVRTLARGLMALPAAEKAGLRILGLTGLTWGGKASYTEDLASFEGTVQKLDKAQHLRWAYRHRVALTPAMVKLGARVLHQGTPEATPLGLHLTRCKHLVTCHDLIDLRFPKQYLGAAMGWEIGGNLILRRRFRRPDHLLAISDCTAGDLTHFIGVAPSKITRVYNSIEASIFHADRPASDDAVLSKRGLSRDGYLLYVGDLDWRKNVEGMLFGLQQAKHLGAHVPLAFAGALGPEKVERLEGLARAAGVSNEVLRLGYVADDELAALYRNALAHVFVSRAEGFGLTVAEAMACACPVITTAGTSLAEVAGDAGVDVDPEDPAAIGRAIARVASDGALRDELRRRGVERARLFAPENQARGTLSIYRRMCGLA